MSTFAYMRFLEASPERYDAGIRRLTRGRIDGIYEEIADLAVGEGRGRRLLDIGCGTGGVSLACAANGARVVGIDANAGMLEVARGKAEAGGLDAEFVELGAMEIQDRFEERSFDAAVSCLAFSEMLPEERRYVLGTVRSRLAAGGILVVGDEVLPRRRWTRIRNALLRWPGTVLTFLLTQQTTRPIRDLVGEIAAAGFVDVEERRRMHDGFAIVTARRGGEG